jgi:hypothetical protein
MLAGAILLNNKKRKEQYGFEKKEKKRKDSFDLSPTIF